MDVNDSEMAEVEKQLRDLLRSNPLNVQDANMLRSRCVRLSSRVPLVCTH